MTKPVNFPKRNTHKQTAQVSLRLSNHVWHPVTTNSYQRNISPWGCLSYKLYSTVLYNDCTVKHSWSPSTDYSKLKKIYFNLRPKQFPFLISNAIKITVSLLLRWKQTRNIKKIVKSGSARVSDCLWRVGLAYKRTFVRTIWVLMSWEGGRDEKSAGEGYWGAMIVYEGERVWGWV